MREFCAEGAFYPLNTPLELVHGCSSRWCCKTSPDLRSSWAEPGAGIPSGHKNGADKPFQRSQLKKAISNLTTSESN